MKICRYDDNRLGIVIGDMVHDVTAAQTEIRNSTPYAAKVDAVIAAPDLLPSRALNSATAFADVMIASAIGR